MLIRRAVLMTIAGASLFWMLFGALDIPAAAAGITAHFGGAAPAADSSGSAEPEDEPGHHCNDKAAGDPGDHDPCCEERCCRSEPSPRPSESPEPTAEPTAVPAPTPHAKRAPAPTPRTPSTPGRVVATSPGGSSTTHPSPVPARDQDPASGARAPVLAPPELTIPGVTPVGASGSATVGAIPVIALSTVLVAATIAAVSLVLMRRSS